MKKKLGEILVAQGVVSVEDVDQAINTQSGGDPARIGDLLTANGKVTHAQLAKAISEQSGLPLVKLDRVPATIVSVVPQALQKEHALVPFKDDVPQKVVWVAAAEPLSADAKAALEEKLGRSVKLHIAARDEIERIQASPSAPRPKTGEVKAAPPSAPRPSRPKPPASAPSSTATKTATDLAARRPSPPMASSKPASAARSKPAVQLGVDSASGGADVISSIDLPAWMHESGETGKPADDLARAMAAPLALDRLVRLMIKRGILNEEEILKELIGK